MATSIAALPNELSNEEKANVSMDIKDKNIPVQKQTAVMQQNPAPENTQMAELSKDSINYAFNCFNR